MSTKIEGAVSRHFNEEGQRSIELHLRKEDQLPTDHGAVLIVSSDGQPPRYFTQEEVKAMLREMLDCCATYDVAGHHGDVFHEVAVEEKEIRAIAAERGIKLD